MRLAEIDTPAAILDHARLVANTARMKEKAAEHGVRLRPHLKTAKCAEVAELAASTTRGPITVSTPSEIAFFASHGFFDQCYAVCLVPSKLRRIIELMAQFPKLSVSSITDCPELVVELDAVASGAGRPISLLIEIDSGERRSGVAPESDALLEIAEIIARCSSMRLAGVLTHGGHSYACQSAAALQEVAMQERLAVMRAAARLKNAGYPCPEISIGSTPTVVAGQEFAGITEIRPGVYTFFDLTQVALGVCEEKDIALSVLTTVISLHRSENRLIIDAGALALSKDVGPGGGYGHVTDLAGRRLGDLRVVGVDQEHGYVTGTVGHQSIKVGDRLRVLPNHACITAACHDAYFVLKGTQVAGSWARVRGF